MPSEIGRWRFTMDVYAAGLTTAQQARLELLVRTFFEALFPYGVVEGYPDIQPVTHESAFRE